MCGLELLVLVFGMALLISEDVGSGDISGVRVTPGFRLDHSIVVCGIPLSIPPKKKNNHTIESPQIRKLRKLPTRCRRCSAEFGITLELSG